MLFENVERTAKVGRTAPSRNLVNRNSNPEAFDKAIDDTCNTLRDLYNGVRISGTPEESPPRARTAAQRQRDTERALRALEKEGI